ncbi:CHAT domain-containing tetratricopeptide repeat protein [Roseitalea porphyridii]|jgi:CHAT domain-containing protein
MPLCDGATTGARQQVWRRWRLTVAVCAVFAVAGSVWHPAQASPGGEPAASRQTPGPAATAEDPLYEADRLATQAETLFMQSRYREALELFERSLALFESELGPDDIMVARALNGLAATHARLADYESALPFYQRSLDIFDSYYGADNTNTNTATLLNNLALAYQETGRYALALPLYRRSLAIVDGLAGRERDAAMIQRSLAMLHHGLGDHERALAMLDQAIDIYEQSPEPNDADRALFLNSLALLHSDMANHRTAISLYEQSLNLLDAADLTHDHPTIGRVLHNLATAHRELGEHDVALPMYLRSLAIRQRAFGADHTATAASLDNLALLYGETGQYALALSLHRRSLLIRETLLGPGHPHTALTLARLAALHHARGRPQAAIVLGKRAVNALQSTRASIWSLEAGLRARFDDSVADTYEDLAQRLIEAGRLGEAMQVLDLLKERDAFDYLRSGGGNDVPEGQAGYTKAEAQWVDAYDGISRRLGAISRQYEQLQALRRTRDLNEEERARRRALLDARDVARAAFRDQMDGLFVTLAAEAEAGADDDFLRLSADRFEEHARELRARQDTLGELGPGTVLIYYALTDEALVIIVTTASSQWTARAGIDRDRLRQLITLDFAGELGSPWGNPMPAARELYDAMIRPIRAQLDDYGARTLMFSMQDALRYVPPAALHDGERFLIEDFAIALHSSEASDKLRERFDVSDVRSDGLVAGLGTVQAHAGFSALPAVGRELDSIVIDVDADGDADGVAAGTIARDDDFDRSALHTALEDGFPVLHLATHFHFEPANQHNSFLLLGNGDRMTLTDIEDSFERRDGEIDLVTLSACQTAVGSARSDGKDIDALSAVVLGGGARSVLATLWKVADESTGDLMVDFYQMRFDGGLNKAEALRQAQLAMLRGETATIEVALGAGVPADGTPDDGTIRGSFNPEGPSVGLTAGGANAAPGDTRHPFHWAPFILTGNWL